MVLTEIVAPSRQSTLRPMIPPYKIKKIDAFLREFDPRRQILIDARTPAEFAEDHVPGAINLPVLNNQERAEIGTLYKENSFEARHQGAIRVSRNIAAILPKIEALVRDRLGDALAADQRYHKPGLEFVVYCWRGGMRSGSLFTVMDLVGYHAAVIEGGYRSFRKMIHDFFYEELPPFEIISVHGPSGSGKSELMHRLREAGHAALFLEDYAHHRGSLLGGDFATQPSQKDFETQLWSDIARLSTPVAPAAPVAGGASGTTDDDRPVSFIVEGESRQIGRLTIPPLFFDRMMNGPRIWVELPIEERARRLAGEYDENTDELLARLERLRKYLSRAVYGDVVSHVERGDRVTAALILLREHYDGYYRRVEPGGSIPYMAVCRAENVDGLVERVQEALVV